MSKPKTRAQEKLDDFNELLDHYVYSTKGETLTAQKGLMLGWLARIAATDYDVSQELEARLNLARQQSPSSKIIV
jgi:hypothetical protein